MEYFDKSKFCRNFLDQYSETLYPKLLPKLMKVAIYSLYKAYNKWNITMEEIDDFIHYFTYKNQKIEYEKNQKLMNGNNYIKQEESKYNNNNYNYNCPPCDEYYIAPNKKIKKLNMGYIPDSDLQKNETENNINIKQCYGYGKFYPNDDIYINDSNNFYDENYYIPRSRSFRNIQLYHKRLANPKFITQEKRIYPHWWWNIKDDIEQDDYSDDDSEVDHRPSRPGRFPKKIEDKLRKKMKRQKRNKSFNVTRPVFNQNIDENKIFPNNDINNNINNDDNNPNNDYNNNYGENNPYPYQGRDYSPSNDDSRKPPFGNTAMDGFGRPYINPEDNINNNNYNRMNNSMNIRPSPLNINSQNSNYRMPPNTLGLIQNPMNNSSMSPNNGFINYESNKSPYNQTGDNNSVGNPNATSSNFSSSTLKNQILNKRKMKESTVLSFDKDFNVNGIRKKVKGKTKKGVKYSVSGNQLNEDQRGIRRRKK